MRDHLLVRHWQIVALLILVAVSLAAPLIAPYDPLSARNGDELLPPSAQHWLGTDLIGRDVLTRTLYGGRQTLLVAVLALLVAGIPGTLIGLLAGYLGGWVDRLTMALLDALLSIPALLLAMSTLAISGRGLAQVALAAGFAALPGYARLVRANVLPVRSSLYLEATRALGAPPQYLLFRTLLPNVTLELIGALTVVLGWTLLNAAALNYLGFGGDPGIPEWGAMLAEARQVFRVAPWVAIAPGTAIMLTLMLINALADSLIRPHSR